MKSTTKQLSDSSVELTVTIDHADLAIYKSQALEELSVNLKVPGFRKGKVPADVAAKHLDPTLLTNTILDLTVRTTAPVAFAEAQITPLASPEVTVTKYVPDELLEYTAKADIIPPVKLGKYTNLKVKRPVVKVTDAAVDEALQNIRRSFAESKTVQRAAKLGDEVQLDFTGKKDGVAFDGGHAKDYKLLLGSGQFIPGFEDGVVGHKVGEQFELALTFPKDYGNADLAGAKTTFEVLVKQINEQILPKLDDKLAQQCGPFKTLAELEADVRKNLQAQDEHKTTERYKDDLVRALVEASKVPAPDVLVTDQLKAIHADLENNVERAGSTFEKYLESLGQTREQWETEARKVAAVRVQAALALTELAKLEKLSATKDETEAKLAELRDVYKNAPDALKQLEHPRVAADIQHRLTIEKAIDRLVALNSK
jgi:trigger factor